LPKGWLEQSGSFNIGFFDRWLLRRVRTIVVGGAWEASCLDDQGFGAERVRVIPPGVELGPVMNARAGAQGNPAHENGFNRAPAAGRRIVCVGNLEPSKGFREALRAADFLAYPFPDVHFYVLGDGPQLAALERSERGAYHRDRIHLLGGRPDAGVWLKGADLCWVPSLAATGRHVALEAMAAGCAVIASDLPLLREVVSDGTSGLLVRPGDRLALARRSRELLLDDGGRRRLAERAKQHVRQHFPAALFLDRWRSEYRLTSSASSCHGFPVHRHPTRAEF
jgi:glycosyltransferase involved in cell wall biosynthesis